MKKYLSMIVFLQKSKFDMSKILTRLRSFGVKMANFSRLHCLAIPRRDLSTKKTTPNIEKLPESLEVLLEF